VARFNFVKDPNARLEWLFDWTDWLEDGETIATSTVTADDGLTVDSTSHGDSSVVAWLTGGTTGTAYRVTNHITTSDARADDRSISVRVMDR
jgi:hypothetical protein